jgi:cell division protein FtsI (penicillin-binding protein 3)
MATRLADVLRFLPLRLKIEGSAKQTIDVARHRLFVGGSLFALAFLVVAFRLVDLTMLNEGREPRIARAPRLTPIEMDRADVVDRNDTLLATSLRTGSLYANPRQLLDPDDAARRLARTLPGLNEAELLARLRSERSFVWVRRSLTPRQQAAVNRLGIPGLFYQREERRIYPHGALTGHIVGFTDIDGRGIAGTEQYFDERLRRDNEPLRLSIDIRAQHILREELTRQIAEFRAIGGSAIVMDSQNGEVMAMVSLPDFDSNTPALASPEQRFNRNTLGVYEMGSTFKIFTLAGALDYGTANLNASYDASRPIEIGRFTIHDFQGQRRWLTLPEVFMYSSNIGAVRIAMQLGRERQREFLTRLGLTRSSPIELPEVGAPMLPNPWRDINSMTIAFGHGMGVSPMQLITAANAAMNGGVLVRPTLLRRAPGAEVPRERVMAARTSEQMRRLMRLVVERGSARAAAAPGYLVGGKTGTAEKNVRGRYRTNARLSLFTGGFPITDPRYAILIILDEPQPTATTHGFATGGWVAAPMVARLVPRLAALWGIPPMDENQPMVREQLFLNVAARR